MGIFRKMNFDKFKKSVPSVPDLVARKIIRNNLPKNVEPRDKIRGFDAANQGNLTSDWFAPSTNINALLKGQLTVLKARSRERMRNDDYANGYKRMFVANVIGPFGMKLQALIKNFDGERDTFANEAIEQAWNSWAKYKENVDVTGRENWKDVLVQLSKTFVTDGEVFLRHIIGQEGGEYGYRVQVIDPILCDHTLNTTLGNGNQIVLGVELNKWNKPVAYYFTSNDESSSILGANGNMHIKVPAKEIIHFYTIEFPGQVRGIPPLSCGINRLKMLAGFEEAALVNARASAARMGFYVRNGDDTTPGIEDSGGELIDEITPGVMTLLPDGYDIRSFDSQYPDGEIAPFKKNMLRALASGLGVDYPTLGQDLESVNLASARVAINETRELWKGVQQLFIDNIVTPVYEMWLLNALVRKKIIIKNIPLQVAYIDKYKDVRWLPRRWQFPDPSKDSKAAVDMLNNRVKSLSTVASDLGIDWETEIQTMAKDEELLSKLGLKRITTTQVAIDEAENLDEENSEM